MRETARIGVSALSAGDGPDHNKRFFAGGDRFGEHRIGGLMRYIIFASEKTQECASLESIVLANRAAQHGVACFQRIQHAALRNRRGHFEFYFARCMRQGTQMKWKYDANHINASFSLASVSESSRMRN